MCFLDTCVATGAEGAPCDLDDECDGGLVCSCFNDACGDCGAGGDPGGTREVACLGG